MEWNQIAQAIQELGKDVSGKVKETTDVLKLRQKANVEKQRIIKAYEEIGRLYVKEYDGKEVAPEYQEYFAVIAEASEAVKEFKSKINEIRNTKTCPECGAEMEKEAAFCAKCGARMPEEPEEEDAEDADFCEADEEEACENGEAEEAAAEACACEKAEEAEACGCEEAEEAETCDREEAEETEACECQAAEETEAEACCCAVEEEPKEE